MTERFRFEVVDALHYDEPDPSTRRRPSRGSLSAVASVPARAWSTWRRGRVVSRVDSWSWGSTWSRWSRPRTCGRCWSDGSRRCARSWRRRSRCRSTTARSTPSSWATRSITSTAKPRWRRPGGPARPGGGLGVFWAWPDEEELVKIPGMRRSTTCRAGPSRVRDRRRASLVGGAASRPGRLRAVRTASSRGATSCRPRASSISTRLRATSCRCRARRATRCWIASDNCRVRSRDAPPAAAHGRGPLYPELNDARSHAHPGPRSEEGEGNRTPFRAWEARVQAIEPHPRGRSV